MSEQGLNLVRDGDITMEMNACVGCAPMKAVMPLTAKAATGWVFQGWSGACTGGAGTKPCSVTVDAAKAVTATFISSPTVSVSPANKKFNNVKANSKTSIAAFTVTNKTTKGSANLVIGAIAPNGKCTFKAVFQPL